MVLMDTVLQWLLNNRTPSQFIRVAALCHKYIIRQLKGLPTLVPPIEIQVYFNDFVAKAGQSKLTIQQSLDKLELLKKSLMQQYFG